MAWFVKLEEGIVPKSHFDRVVPDHLAWLETLEPLGHQPISGYWGDRRGRLGDGAGGMLLFWASDWEAAEALVRQDPLIVQGCVRWTLHTWTTVFGTERLPRSSGDVQEGRRSGRTTFRNETAAPGLS